MNPATATGSSGGTGGPPDNHNSVVLARSGAGKSYLVKLDVLRYLYDGVQVAVIDPEDEYTRLADAVGGTVVQLGPPGVRVNPLDLPAGDRTPATGRPAPAGPCSCTPWSGCCSASHPHRPSGPPWTGRSCATYATAGISNDPATWTRPAPLLRDLVAVLDAAAPDSAAPTAADALGRRSAPGRPGEAGGSDAGGPVDALDPRVVQGLVRRTHDLPTVGSPGRVVDPAPARTNCARPGC